MGAHLEKAEEVLGQHLRHGRELALSDLVPLVSVGGKRLRPRRADHRERQGEDVRLRQVAVVLQQNHTLAREAPSTRRGS